MNWKCETRLDDLSPGTLLEMTCKTCGVSRLETPRDLISKARLGGACLDEVEQALSCMGRPQTGRRANRLPGAPALCRGQVELTLIDAEIRHAVAGE
jgi:hypothetical protein